MESSIPGFAIKVLEALTQAGYEAFLVGGCVRDILRSIPPKDIDITTSALPDQIKGLFSHTAPTGERFGTVTVLLPEGKAEVTTYRIDGKYTDKRRPDSVAFSSSLREDLSRRDFTINAMAWNPQTGLVDLFGGRDDISERLIRCVGEPERRFGEDALRILRAYRFCAQMNFVMEEKTLAAARAGSSLIGAVSPERIREELLKILFSNHPDVALDAVRDGCFSRFGLSRVEKGSIVCLPEQFRLAGFLVKTTSDPMKLLSAMRFDNKSIEHTIDVLKAASAPLSAEPVQLRYMLMQLGYEAVSGGIAVRRVIFEEQTQDAERELERIMDRGDCCRISQLKVNGDDLLALARIPGPEVGRLLHVLLLSCIEDPSMNTREKLVLLAKEYMQKLQN